MPTTHRPLPPRYVEGKRAFRVTYPSTGVIVETLETA